MEYNGIILSEEEKEIIKIENQEEEESLSLERYAFNSFRIERSIRDILNWVEKGKIIIPEFQRDFVWNYNQSSRFVESVLLGLPIPDFFMFRLIDNKEQFERYILIDGLQRYTTIKQFVEGRFVQGATNRNFKINNKSSQWYNKTYAKLDTNDQDFFQDYSLKINVFDSVEDSERMQKLYMTTIFERINTGSTKLSAQEVRNAIFNGEVTRHIRVNVKNNNFSLLLQADLNKYSQRCKNEEFYLRLLTYYHVYLQITKKSNFYIDDDEESKLSSSKDLMLCNFLFYCNKKDIDFADYNKKLLHAISLIAEFDNTAFCTVKRDENIISNHIHEVFSEALVIALMTGSKINITKEQFEKAKITIWRDQEKYIEFFHTTTELSHVQKRIDTIKKVLAGEI